MVQNFHSHVIITGMHRSGTSFLSRALNLSGVDLGPISQYYDTEIKPIIGNPKGHWENFRINQLNENILKINDGAWDKVPQNLDKIPIDFENQVKTILNQFYSHKSLVYGFKDPRFCITLEKWIQYLSKFTIVGIFRHPLKVAESLKVRNNFDYHESLNLWQIHNTKLLSYIKKYDGFLIDFDWPTKKLLDETTSICQKLGLPKINFESWFSIELKKSDKSFDSTFPLSKKIKELYDELRQLSEKNSTVKYVSIKPTQSEYEEILRDTILNSNSFYDETVKLALKEVKNLKERQISSNRDPIGTLLSIYYTRPDMQKSFSEISDGNYDNLFRWTKNIFLDPSLHEENSKKILTPFKNWFFEKSSDLQLNISQISKYIESIENHLKNNNMLLNELKDKQQTSITTLQEDNSKLQGDNSKLQGDNSKLQGDNSKLQEDNSKLQEDNFKLQNNLFELTNHANSVNKELIEYQKSLKEIKHENSGLIKELNDIRSSFGFKIMRMYGTTADKLLKKKALENTIEVASTSINVIKSEGLGSYIDHVNQKLKRKEFKILSTKSQKIPTVYSSINNHNYTTFTIQPISNKSKYNVSVVIPTNSDIELLQDLINKIQSQNGLLTLEIILVNSGMYDLRPLESNIVKLISIPKHEFNHGMTRNIGAKESKGDYIIFLTDDAMPISNHLFYDLCFSIEQDSNIAVSTGIQIPKSGSDLIYQFFLYNHYAILNMTRNQIRSSSNFEKLSSLEKRQISQIDNVCACYKKIIFQKYQYRQIQYAEDLDIGLRLISDGFKIAQLTSSGVIHSHNRSAAYYTKRGVIDTIMVSSLLGNDSNYSFQLPLNELLNHINSINTPLKIAIEKLKQSKIESISESINFIITTLQSQKFMKKPTFVTDLDELLLKLPPSTANSINKNNMIYLHYVSTLQRFENYLNQTFANLTNIENEFLDSVYKLFGWTIGNILGSYIVYTKTNGNYDTQVIQIEKILISDV